MRNLKPLLALYAVAALLFAQSGPKPINQMTTVLQIRPQAIPTSLTSVTNVDTYLCEADFAATGQTILVEDNQSAPVPFLTGALTGTFGFVAQDDARCRWFPNGVSVQAGGAGVTGYMTLKCNKCNLQWGQ